MLRRWLFGFLCLCPPIKWWTKPLLSCLKSTIIPWGILLDHTFVAPFSVVGNALHITSSRVICNSISVLNDSMWSKGSLKPLYDSNCGRWNFGGRGRFNTSVVNGESILRINLYKFSPPFSFMALFNSSISFLCCEAHSPSWKNLFLRSCLTCWLKSLILLHSGFRLFTEVLHFRISLSFAALHSGESAPPH